MKTTSVFIINHMRFPSYILLLAQMMNLIILSNQQLPPIVERCTSEGNRICVDCFRSADCAVNGDEFSITNVVACPTTPKTYCDDTLYPQDTKYYGQCAPLPASYTKCGCTSDKTCVPDPNFNGTVLHCESDPPVTDPPCIPPSSHVDWDKCRCIRPSYSAVCPLLDDPEDDCAKYYINYQNQFLPDECSDGLCFSQSDCKCLSKGQFVQAAAANALRSADSLKTFELVEAYPECAKYSSGCPFVKNPHDDCASYFLCGMKTMPMWCPDPLCFNQETCLCEPTN